MKEMNERMRNCNYGENEYGLDVQVPFDSPAIES
jgi:hypothetical protein